MSVLEAGHLALTIPMTSSRGATKCGRTGHPKNLIERHSLQVGIPTSKESSSTDGGGRLTSREGARSIDRGKKKKKGHPQTLHGIQTTEGFRLHRDHKSRPNKEIISTDFAY